MKQLIIFVSCLMLLSCGSVEKQYQGDMDKIRVNDIQYSHGLIKEYNEATGVFPLQNSIDESDIQVFITHRKIPASILKQSASFPLENYSVQQLQQDFEKVLNCEVTLPSDPQNVATFAPNFYIYQVTREWACIAGHLYSPVEGSKNVRNQYHKYEICSNRA